MAVSSNVAVAGSGGAASKSGGLGVLLYSNAQHGVGGSTPAHTSGAPLVAPTAGTARAFTEALLKSALQATYIASGDIPDAVYLSPAHKGVFSAFTGIAVNRYQVDKKEQGRVIGGADVYMGDFGSLEVVPHYIMAGSTNVFGLEAAFIDAVYLRGFNAESLGRSGDSVREQVLVDGTIRVTSEMAQFAVKDLSGG